MTLTFEQPVWLLALLLALPSAWLALRWFGAMSRIRRISAIVARTLLFALLVGMLAGASAVRTTNRLAVVAVVDISESVRLFAHEQGRPPPLDRVRNWLTQALARRGSDDLAGLVVFDGRAVALAAPSLADPLARWTDIPPRTGSSLADALRTASSLIPPDAAGRLVLFSDGNDTQGRIDDALASLAEAGATFPVDVVPVEYQVQREVLIERLDTPPTAAPDSPVVVRMTLRSTHEARGLLRLLRDGEPVDLDPDSPETARPVSLRPGLNTQIIRLPGLAAGRLHRFEALFEPAPGADTVIQNNRAQAFTLTPGPGAVLLVDGLGAAGGLLARTLREEGLRVEVVAPENMPASLLEYQQYDCVILQNVPAEATGTDRHALLASYVRDLAGGLVMIGGPDSFGAGAWKGTEVEDILPVRLDLPEKAVMPEAAIVFVLDSSGSMSWNVMGSARSKQQIANEAAALAVRTLDKKDLVGVISFSSSPRVVQPLSENSDPQSTMQRILSIAPGGGTDLGPALDLARAQLDAVDAKLKHVIVLTDGRSTDPELLPEQAAQMRQRGIRVTTIGVGEDADAETLDQMAAAGEGTFHLVMNPNVLPRVFVRAVRVIRQPLIREQPFIPVITGVGSPYTLAIDQPPALGGLVLTQARKDPLAVVAMRTPQGEPLLAHWQVELGQVVAFTSDASGPWSRQWAAWPGYRTFWTQVVRRASRPPQDQRYDTTIEHEGGQLTLRVEAYDDDGSPRDLLDMPAGVYAPDGHQLDLTLTQTGPGLYEARIPAPHEGGYVFVVKPRLGTRRLPPIVAAVSIPAAAETSRLTSNRPLLEHIARTTAGRVLSLDDPAGANLFDRTDITPRRALIPIWRSLLAWAIIILLLDIGTRRIAWDRLVSREFGADLREMAREAVEQRGERASRLVSGLSRIKRRPAPQEAALSDSDAEALARQELLARRESRLAQLRKARQRVHAEHERLEPGPDEPSAPSRSSPTRAAESPAEDRPADASSSLLEAKRRARRRFEAGDDNP